MNVKTLYIGAAVLVLIVLGVWAVGSRGGNPRNGDTDGVIQGDRVQGIITALTTSTQTIIIEGIDGKETTITLKPSAMLLDESGKEIDFAFLKEGFGILAQGTSSGTDFRADKVTAVTIMITNPERNEVISSPLIVEGRASGIWFFEANLGVELLDANGKVVAKTYGMSTEDWMTTEFVPFTSEVRFSNPATATGILRIRNDNPSGLPQFDRFYDVPVRFSGSSQAEGATTTVKAFFGSTVRDSGGNECQTTYSVTRVIPKTAAVGQAALGELLKGPTADERAKGFFTSLPPGVKLKRLTITNGTALAEFNEELDRTGGSCRVTAIRSQITETLKQFPAVREVVISINGRTEDILQP